MEQEHEVKAEEVKTQYMNYYSMEETLMQVSFALFCILLPIFVIFSRAGLWKEYLFIHMILCAVGLVAIILIAYFKMRSSKKLLDKTGF